MKNKNAIAIVLAMLILMSVSVSAFAAGPKVQKVKLSTAFGESSSVQKAAEKFRDLITEKTEGRFEIEIYPSNQLASGNQVGAIEMTQQGTIDLDLCGFCIYSNLDPRCAVINMPFILPTDEDVDNIFFNGPGREALDQVVSEMGLVPIGWGTCGYRQITNNIKEIKTPEDMKNMKFRVPGMPLFLDVYNTIGANTTSISMDEVFTALQQNVVEGQENAVDTTYSYNLQEVQKFCSCWNGIYDPLLFSASPEFWMGLSDEDRAIFQECADETMAYQIDFARSQEEEILQKFEDAGCHVTRAEDIDVEAFKEAVAPVYNSWKDKVGADMLKAFGFEG